MFARKIGDFLRNRSGNFALISGLVAIPLILALGGALDVNRLYIAANNAEDAAEAAALAAASEFGKGNGDQAKIALQVFGEANLVSNSADVLLSDVVDMNNGTVTVTAKGNIHSTFLKLAKIETLNFERSATVRFKQEAFVQLHFLLDISESMNIGASEVDRDKLRSTTQRMNNRACAFACHIWEDLPFPMNTPFSVYQMNSMAGSDRARLRIEVVREASANMIRKLLARNKDPKSLLHIQIKTGTFNYQFVPRFGPSADEALLIKSIDGTTIAEGGTDFNKSLSGFSADLGVQGDGRTKETPIKIALMITDGVRDSGGHGPLIPTPGCSQIKDKKISLGVLEIKHVWDRDPYGYFDDRVMPFYTQISPNLSKCASDGLYDLATDADQSADKLLLLIDKLLVSKLRVTK